MASGAVGLAVLASLPYWADSGTTRLIAEMAYYLALAQLWNLLAGYAGLVSVGQQVFIGLGGYAFFVLCGPFGVHPYVGVLAAGLFAALMSLPIALFVFRLRGAYFAIGTWVVAEAFSLRSRNSPRSAPGRAISLTPAIVRMVAPDRAGREMIFYWVSLAIAVAALALVYGLLRSRIGLALTAIRDSEPASRSIGVDAFRTKLMTFVVVAMCTGFTGGLIFLQKLRISPQAGFSLQGLDRRRDLHGGDRRHRHSGGADHRHAHLFRAARNARRLRHLVPDRHGRRSRCCSCSMPATESGAGSPRASTSICFRCAVSSCALPTTRRRRLPPTPIARDSYPQLHPGELRREGMPNCRL